MVLQIGNVASTLIQGIAGILVARLLQPELFGIYSLAFGIAGVASVFLGFVSQESVSAILGRAYSTKDRGVMAAAMAFVSKTITVSGIAAVASMAILPFLSMRLYHNSMLGMYAGIFTVALFFSNSFFAVARVALQLAGNIATMTWLIVGDQLIRSGLSILFVLLGFGVAGAVSGHLVGGFILAILSFFVLYQLRLKTPGFFAPLFRIRDWIPARHAEGRGYFNFTAWVTLDRNISVLYSMLPLAMTGLFVAPREVGFFRLAFSYINLVLSLLAPISMLLNVEFARMSVDGKTNLRRNFVRVSLYSMALSALLTAGAIGIAPIFFRILYGQNFLPSVPYVAGLFLYGLFFGLGIGLGSLWRALDRVKTSIIINVVTLGIGVPLGFWLIRTYGSWGSVIMVTAWYAASHITSFLYLRWHLRFIESR